MAHSRVRCVEHASALTRARSRTLDIARERLGRSREGASRARATPARGARASERDDDGDALDRRPSDDASTSTSALVPAFLAMRRGSRFACQEFVRRASAGRRRGATTAAARADAAVFGLSPVMRMGVSELDAFASSLAMVHLTMEFMGEGMSGDGERANDPEARGMLNYIEATHKNCDEGYTLKRMELERRFANTRATRASSPGEALMRSNCKLTLLTREMLELERGIASARLKLTAEEQNEEFISASVDDVEMESQAQVALGWCTRERTKARSLAADMLVGFFSVLTGHPVGYKSFVAAARAAFEEGISANELTSALEAPEFDVEGTRRGMFGRSADAPKLFAGFVTTAYIALEAEGLTLPSSARGDEELFAYADHPCAPEDAECAAPLTDEQKRRAVKGLRQAIDAWLQMDRDALADQVSMSLSEDEGDEDSAKPLSKSASSSATTDDSFVVLRDDGFVASSITLLAFRHQRNIVSFVVDDIARSRSPP